MYKKIAVCVIVREENRYINDWIRHYYKLGFDHVFVCDNNNKERLFISDQFEYTYVDFTNKDHPQNEAYQYVYDTYGKDYDWIAFFDADEYLVLIKHDDIHSFLDDYEEFDCVRINWLHYGDSDNIWYEPKPVQERFTNPLIIHHKNMYVKSIVKTGKTLKVFDPHLISDGINAVDVLKNPMGNQIPFVKNYLETYAVAYLKHYVTKTADEYRIKLSRGDAYFNHPPKNEFFLYNKHTVETDKILEKYVESNDDLLKIFVLTHKAFEYPEEIYKNFEWNKLHQAISDKPIDGIEVNASSNNTYLYKGPVWSELVQIWWMINRAKDALPEYVGTSQYRKFFDFSKEQLINAEHIKELVDKHGVIALDPPKMKSIRHQYNMLYNSEDFDIFMDVMKTNCDEQTYKIASYYFNNNSVPLYPCNMFIMKKEHFIKCYTFVFKVLEHFDKALGCDTPEDYKKRVSDSYDKYVKPRIDTSPFSREQYVELKSRIPGYIGERLASFWVWVNFHKNIKTVPQITTIKKYDNEVLAR